MRPRHHAEHPAGVVRDRQRQHFDVFQAGVDGGEIRLYMHHLEAEARHCVRREVSVASACWACGRAEERQIFPYY